MWEVMARMREQVGCGSRRGSRLSLLQSTVHSLQSTSSAGFTLLEVLVAMGILMMIVMMMATLFSQSTTAWDRGISGAKMSLKGRAVMRMIQHEFAQAVADGGITILDAPDGLECDIEDGESGFIFWMAGDLSGDGRMFRRIEYWKSGTDLIREETSLDDNDTPGQYGAMLSPKQSQLLNNVASFEIRTPGGSAYTTNLPAWVDIKLVLTETVGEVAGIGVWSEGRDGSASTNDNINTW